ncbi:phosphate ABC transporter permease PstA [Halobacterium zhouii]|uniref:phosphate ABC transporter permease PstA n=1 Tax=Halobacterium zhouii TaxID=2902624 RepID=UPI001E35677E|nr:phosphate ABC transporter permease PstA [Halobacterium zhouii]
MSNTESQTEFGEVSEIKGVVFEYVTLVASVVGILSLGALLAYVAWDAFGLETASNGWYATYAATLVLPVVGFIAYARTRPAVAKGAFELLTMTLAGIMGTFATVIVLSIITGPEIWFAYFLTVIGPATAVLVYGQYDREATWVGLVALAVFVVGPVVGTLALPWLTSLGALLGDPGIYFLTLVVPAAGLVAFLANDQYGTDPRTAILAGLALLVAAFAGVPVVDALPSVSRSVWLIVLVTFGIPVGVAVANVALNHHRRPAFALPAIVVGGFLLGEFVVGIIDATAPSPWFDWQFLTSGPSVLSAEQAGLYPAIIGSIFLIVLVSVFTFVFGFGTAVYLEEYAPQSGLLGTVTRIININVSNLAGVPSVVYGLLGLGIFVNVQAELGPIEYSGFGVGTVLTAALTLSLLILPIVVISAQEALRSVPESMRKASYGMGATRWQTTRNVVLPRALPGTLTGTIIALGRAIGETAPLIMIGAATTKFTPPDGLFSMLTAMPMQIYAWAFQPDEAFRHGVVAAGVVTLLIVLVTMNSVAILLRNKYQQESN